MFVVYPLATLTISSLASEKGGGISFQNYIDFITLKYYRSALINSFVISGLATIFAIMIGFPLAYVSTRYDIKFKGILQMIIIMSLLSPPFIGAYSWIMLMGNNGIITNFVRDFGINIPSI